MTEPQLEHALQHFQHALLRMAERGHDLARAARELGTRQLCEALGEPYETPDGHGMRAHTYEEALAMVEARSGAWRTLLGRIEEVDPEWLDRWRQGLAAPPDRLG